MSRLERAIKRLIEETRRAYEFSPGSYTHGAHSAALAVQQEHYREDIPDWIDMEMA